MTKCLYCGANTYEIPHYASFICKECDSLIEEDIYNTAKQVDHPEKTSHWVNMFKNKYREQHVLEAMWRLVGDHRADFTSDWRLEII